MIGLFELIFENLQQAYYCFALLYMLLIPFIYIWNKLLMKKCNKKEDKK